MKNEIEKLHERVEQCRRHLATAELDAHVRAEFLRLLTDLENSLTDEATVPKSAAVESRNDSSQSSPIERMRNLERSLETTHPVLCGLVGNLADSLSRLGI